MATNNRKIELHIHLKGVESWGDLLNIDMKSVLPISPIEGQEEAKDKSVKKGRPKSPDDLDILFSVAEFAEYFKVSQITVRSWLKKGLISSIRIGKRIRIRKAEILALERRRVS